MALKIHHAPARERLTLYFAKRRSAEVGVASQASSSLGCAAFFAGGLAGDTLRTDEIIALLSHLSRGEVAASPRGAGATFLRVVFTLFLAGLWTVPDRRAHRAETEARRNRAAHRSNSCVGTGDGFVSCDPASADQGRRWARYRLDRSAVARHTVVSFCSTSLQEPVHSDGLKGSY